MKIIDNHSHFGNDFYHGNTNLDEYLNFAINVGINVALMMPVPNPMINGDKVLHCFWNNNYFSYFPQENPFLKVNYKYYEQLEKNKNNQLKMFYVPLIHPNLDRINYLNTLIDELDPVALKIHGTANCVNPFLINDDFIELIKEKNIVLIIHTHYDKKYKVFSEAMQQVILMNSSINWANFLHNNKIKGILNNGACLEPKTIKLINNSEYIKIALGPDKAIENNPNKLYSSNLLINKIGYLKLLKKHINADKIVFDTDYNWDDNNTNCIQRVKLVWNDSDCNKILSENILNFNTKLKKMLIKK